MLNTIRYPGEVVRINDNIEISFQFDPNHRGRIKLSIDAPKEVRILLPDPKERKEKK